MVERMARWRSVEIVERPDPRIGRNIAEAGIGETKGGAQVCESLRNRSPEVGRPPAPGRNRIGVTSRA